MVNGAIDAVTAGAGYAGQAVGDTFHSENAHEGHEDSFFKCDDTGFGQYDGKLVKMIAGVLDALNEESIECAAAGNQHLELIGLPLFLLDDTIDGLGGLLGDMNTYGMEFIRQWLGPMQAREDLVLLYPVVAEGFGWCLVEIVQLI